MAHMAMQVVGPATPAGFDLAGHAERMRRDGYTIVEDFLSPGQLQTVRVGLAPYLGTYSGRNSFEGYRTERVYTLAARGPIHAEIAEDARVLALCGEFLKPGFLLTASQAICIYPGEKRQPLHYDDTFYPLARPRPAVSISTIVAVDAFTAVNGATEILPGSHAWSDAEVAGVYDGRDPEAPTPASLEPRLRAVEMPAGACLVFQGTLLHRGGANRSGAPRLAFSNQYCEPWARTQENFFLAIPREQMQALSPRLHQLLGYSIWPPFMGQVSASHPLKTLEPGYVNAIVAQRPDDSRDS